MTRHSSLVVVTALAAPLLLAAAITSAVAAGERAALTPFAGIVPRNSAEAAAMGHAHGMLQFLRTGEDPHRVYPVRPEIISSSIHYATTLEAAMWARQPELIRLLETSGAITPADRPALICLAADLGVDDVIEHLAPEGATGCVPGQAVEAVQARTTAR